MRDPMRLVLFAALVAFASGVDAQTTLRISNEPAVEGHDTLLTVTDDAGDPVEGASIDAVYRENAHRSIRHVQAIGETTADGALTWRPEQAGVVVLQWTLPGDESSSNQSVAVRYDGIPGAGVAVALIAGVLLLGGSLRFLLRMLATDE